MMMQTSNVREEETNGLLRFAGQLDYPLMISRFGERSCFKSGVHDSSRTVSEVESDLHVLT